MKSTYLPKVAEDLGAIWLNVSVRHISMASWIRPTPAKTLVMSKTRMPASGRLGELDAAEIVARARYLHRLLPLMLANDLTTIGEALSSLSVCIARTAIMNSYFPCALSRKACRNIPTKTSAVDGLWPGSKCESCLNGRHTEKLAVTEQSIIIMFTGIVETIGSESSI